jgi:hypothetical protein
MSTIPLVKLNTGANIPAVGEKMFLNMSPQFLNWPFFRFRHLVWFDPRRTG